MLFNLFKVFFKIGITGFGGGSAVAPLIHKECVEKYKWISDDEFVDIVSVANTLPGPSMAEMATAIGYKKKGLLGALVASAAIILPMAIIFTFIMLFAVDLLGEDRIIEITKPVLVVVSLAMISLTKKFYNRTKKDLGNIFIAFFTSITTIILIVFNLHPSIMIVAMILFVLFFVKGGTKNVD